MEKMTGSLAGKTVLITGSTDGLGKLVARHLAMQDAVVLLHGRNAEKGKAVLDELSTLTRNQNLNYYNADFASLQEVKELSGQLIKEHEQIDILINNVGIGRGPSKLNKREISYDGKRLSKAIAQTDNPEARAMLREVTWQLLDKIL